MQKDESDEVFSKESKESAGYLPPVEGGFKCANCIFFIRGKGPEHGGMGACKLVKGEIDPHGCCNLFKGPNNLYLSEEAEEKAEEGKEDA